MLPPSDSDEEDEVPAAKKPGQVLACKSAGGAAMELLTALVAIV
jgi:hypothetical protein